MQKEETRRRRLLYLIALEYGGVRLRFAEAIDRPPGMVTRWCNEKGAGRITRSIGEQMARHIERCCGKPEGWLDHEDCTAPNLPLVVAGYRAATPAAREMMEEIARNQLVSFAQNGQSSIPAST